jgi:hypothetical protein
LKDLQQSLIIANVEEGALVLFEEFLNALTELFAAMREYDRPE